MKIKDIYSENRPKEKFLEFGFDNLSIVEMLSILLNTGGKNNSAIDISSKLLTKYGSIESISNLSVDELITNKGIGINKAIHLLISLNMHKFEKKQTNIDSFTTLKKLVKSLYVNNRYEVLYILFLDSSLMIIKTKKITQHKKETVEFSFKEIRNSCIKNDCDKIIIVHNHPNNTSYFSRKDIDSFLKLSKFLMEYDIEIVDSILYTTNEILNIKSML